VVAHYAGSANYKQADSDSKTVTVAKRNTTVVVIDSPSTPTSYGQSVTFTATVAGSGAGLGDPSVGSVTFIEGTCFSPTTTLAAATPINGSHQATFSSSTLDVGAHTVRACYGGSTNFGGSDGSKAHAVNDTLPTVALSGSNDLTAPEGSTHTYSFTITDPDPTDSWTFASSSYPDCGMGNTRVAGSATISGHSGSFQCKFLDGPSTAVVKVEVKDTYSATPSNEATQPVTVMNVVPTVTSFGGSLGVLSGPMVNGLTGTFTGFFSDPGVVDNPWVASFNWGGYADPATLILATQGTFSARPQFQSIGCAKTATVTVKDKDNGVSTVFTSAAVMVGGGAFLPPMTNQPVTDQLKNGQVLPVKVSITDCTGAPVNGLAPTIGLKQGDLTDANDNTVAAIPPTSVSGADTTGVMRQSSDGTYMYNLQVNLPALNQAWTVVITPNIPGYASTLTLRHKIIATK
jgi:hypothetical protein